MIAKEITSDGNGREVSHSALLFWGLLLSVFAMFFGSNFLKLASLFICILYVFWRVKAIRKYCGPKFEVYLFIPCVIGLLFSWENNLSDALRDLTFFLIPYVYFMVGKTFYEQGGDIEGLVYRFSRIYSWIFFLLLGFYWFDFGLLNVQIIRDYVSTGSFLLIYCIYFQYSHLTSKRTAISWPLFLVPLIIFVAQSSRTYFLVLLVFFLIPRKNKRAVQNMFYVLLGTAIVALLAVLLGADEAIKQLIEKSIAELTVIDDWKVEDLGSKYRAYESSRAYSVFMSYSPFNLIFGGGFGKLVDFDLGSPVLLAGTEYDAVPVIHNGYLYALVKTGVVGIFSYLIFIAKIFTSPFRYTEIVEANLVKATVIGLLLSNIVIDGFFSLESSFAYIILGYFSGYRISR